MSGLVTGIDAVHFFARFGSETLVKFIHLVPEFDREQVRAHPRNYQPYNLLVAANPGHSAEHFIMSPAGLVHMMPGEPSECTPLSRWMRESVLFSVLRRIPFFKLYLFRKTFNAWSDNVRFSLYARQRAKVQERLFATRQSSCQQLLNIRRLLQDLQQVRVLTLETRTSELEDLVKQSTASCAEAGKHVEALVSKMVAEVESVLSEVTGVYAKLSQDAASAAASTFADSGGADKTKSLVRMKEERAQLLVLRGKAKMEHASLPDFVRSTDLMLIETLVSLAETTVLQLSQLLQQADETSRGNRKAGLLEIVVRYDKESDEHTFSPTKEEVITELRGIVDRVVETICGMRLLRYLHPRTKDQGADPLRIVRASRGYLTAMQGMLDRISDDFYKATDQVQSYQSLKPLHRAADTFLTDLSYDQSELNQAIKDRLELLANWGRELEKLRNKPVGVLEIDSKRLKAELETIRDELHNRVRNFIRDAAREKGTALLELFKDCLSRLGNKPVHLKEFAAYLAMVEQMRSDQNRYFKQINQVDGLAKLLTEVERGFKVATAKHDVAELLDDLHAKEINYRTEMSAVRQFKESRMEDMVESLESLLDKLAKEVTFVLARLNDAIFTDTGHFKSADRVLEDLEQLGQKLEHWEQAAHTYAGYQRVMGLPVTSNPDLELAHEKLEQTKLLWETVRRWNQSSARWMNAEFTSINAEEVGRDVEMLFKESYALHRERESPVSELLRREVGEFRQIVPVILDLGNPHMTPVHFEKLFGLVEEQYYPGMSFSLSTLLDAGILKHAEAVAETSGMASGEARLMEDLAKIRQTWEVMEFSVIRHRDQPGLYVLGSLEEIFTTLEDNQVSLQTMLGNRFVLAIQDKVEEWASRLSTLADTLDEWTACQRSWMYLESIFGAEDIQKQLPSESQQFSSIDRSFKVQENLILVLISTNYIVGDYDTNGG